MSAEKIFQILFILFGFAAAVGIMLCFMREDFRFAWVTTTLAILSLASLLGKIFFIND